MRSDLEALRKDVADVQNSMRTHVLRNGQETSTKLSQVANDVSKMTQALAEVSPGCRLFLFRSGARARVHGAMMR